MFAASLEFLFAFDVFLFGTAIIYTSFAYEMIHLLIRNSRIIYFLAVSCQHIFVGIKVFVDLRLFLAVFDNLESVSGNHQFLIGRHQQDFDRGIIG